MKKYIPLKLIDIGDEHFDDYIEEFRRMDEMKSSIVEEERLGVGRIQERE